MNFWGGVGISRFRGLKRRERGGGRKEGKKIKGGMKEWEFCVLRCVR